MSLYQLVQFKSALVHLFILSAGYYFLRTAIISGAAVIFLDSSLEASKNRIYRLPIEISQVMSELKAGVLILVVDALSVTLLIRYNLFRHTDGPFVLNVLTFFGVFVWYEIWFYATHRLLHTRTFFFIHAQHHKAKVTSPFTALSFSFLERVILLIGGIGLPALISQWVPMSFTAYAAYFSLNYALNVYGHMNVEVLPQKVIKNQLGEVLNSTTYHALHHARFQGHFSLFTPYLDRFFKTRFDDYEKVHQEAFEGRGLERLGIKFSNAQS